MELTFLLITLMVLIRSIAMSPLTPAEKQKRYRTRVATERAKLRRLVLSLRSRISNLETENRFLSQLLDKKKGF